MPYSSTVDLRLCRITNLDGTPANLTSYAPLYTGGNTLPTSMNFAMGGYGQGRGAPLSDGTGYYWDGSGNYQPAVGK